MLKVYLAKSNKANPNVVNEVRQHLESYGLHVVEYEGGNYNHRDLLCCDYLVVVPKPGPLILGKGLYEQVIEFLKKSTKSLPGVTTIQNSPILAIRYSDNSGALYEKTKYASFKGVVKLENFSMVDFSSFKTSSLYNLEGSATRIPLGSHIIEYYTGGKDEHDTLRLRGSVPEMPDHPHGSVSELPPHTHPIQETGRMCRPCNASNVSFVDSAKVAEVHRKFFETHNELFPQLGGSFGNLFNQTPTRPRLRLTVARKLGCI